MQRLTFSVDPNLWGHLRYVTGKDDTELLKAAIACMKWAMTESAKGHLIGSYAEGGEVKSTLTDEAFDRARAALADGKAPKTEGEA